MREFGVLIALTAIAVAVIAGILIWIRISALVLQIIEGSGL